MVRKYKFKGKGHPLTRCASTEERQWYSSNTFVTSLVKLGGRVVSFTLRLLEPWKDPISILQEAGWSHGAHLDSMENITSAGIRSPDRPAHTNHSKIPYTRIIWDTEAAG